MMVNDVNRLDTKTKKAEVAQALTSRNSERSNPTDPRYRLAFLTSVAADCGSGDERADGSIDVVALLALALHELLDADVESPDGGEGGPVVAAHLDRPDEARESDVALDPRHVVPGGDDGAPDGPRGESRHRALHRLGHRRVLLHGSFLRFLLDKRSRARQPQPVSPTLGRTRRDRDLAKSVRPNSGGNGEREEGIGFGSGEERRGEAAADYL
jgi:hypothetical protein